MAQYDEYIHIKTKKQIVVLHHWHQTVNVYGRFYAIPTTVELLDVSAKKTTTISAPDFKRYIEKGYLVPVMDVKLIPPDGIPINRL